MFKINEAKEVKRMNWLLQEESGQGMVEYGLILVLISVAAIGTMTLVGDSLSDMFDSIKDTLTP